MALYMVQGAYRQALNDGEKPQDRSVPVRELLQKLGGRMVGFYFCLESTMSLRSVNSPMTALPQH